MRSFIYILALACICNLAHAGLVQTGEAAWGARYGHSCLFVGDTMHVLGGRLQNNTVLQDVWTSTEYPYTDGALISAAALPAPRAFGGVYLANGSSEFVFFGGNNGVGSVSTVWSSTDGLVWMNHSDAGWGPRERFGVLRSNDTQIVYLFGGLSITGSQVARDDMWRSVDGGRTWTLYSASTGVPARYGFAYAADGTDMYVIGGMGASSQVYSDVWRASVTNAYTTWSQVATAGSPGQRTGAAAFIANEMIHVLSGTYGAVSLSVNSHVQSRTKWKGRMWCLPDNSNPLFPAGFVPSYYGAALHPNGTTLFLSGGFNGSVALGRAYAFTASDLVCNPNQTQWINISSFAQTFGGRYRHSSAYIGDVLYVFGGINSAGTTLSTVLKYTYASGWVLVPHDGSVFTPSNGQASVTHVSTGCIYLWGGITGVSQIANMRRFCGSDETFSVVANDTGFRDTRFGYTIVGSRIFMLGSSGARYSDFPFTSWNFAPFLPPPTNAIDFGSLAYVDGMLICASGIENPFNANGRIWNITADAFVANTGTWTRGNLPIPRRQSFAGVALQSIDTSRPVPVVVSAPVAASFFVGGGQVFNLLDPNSHFLTQGRWKTVSQYPIASTTAGSSWREPNSPGVTTSPDSRSVVLTGGESPFIATTGDMMIYGANACLSDPCACGGTCLLAGNNNNYTCECPPGTSGVRCEMAADICLSSPCENGGSCVSACGVYSSCTCPEGFSGATCANSNAASSSSTAGNDPSASSTASSSSSSSSGSSSNSSSPREMDSSSPVSLTLSSSLISAGVSVSLVISFTLFLLVA